MVLFATHLTSENLIQLVDLPKLHVPYGQISPVNQGNESLRLDGNESVASDDEIAVTAS